MLKFKKEFENHSIALADGTLINKDTISSEHVQSRLTGSPWFSYMLETDSTAPAKSENPKQEIPVKTEAPKKRVRK